MRVALRRRLRAVAAEPHLPQEPIGDRHHGQVLIQDRPVPRPDGSPPGKPASCDPLGLVPGCMNNYQPRAQHPETRRTTRRWRRRRATSSSRLGTRGRRDAGRAGPSGCRGSQLRLARGARCASSPSRQRERGRAKLRSAAVVPVSVPLARLYSEYMHVEYGDLGSDYVLSRCPDNRILSRTRRYPDWPCSAAGHRHDDVPGVRHNGALGLQSFEEGEELVRGLVASGRDVRRGDTVQRFLFQLEVGMDVDLGRANVLVPQPQGDDGTVHA